MLPYKKGRVVLGGSQAEGGVSNVDIDGNNAL
jgi:hypothetical protein